MKPHLAGLVLLAVIALPLAQAESSPGWKDFGEAHWPSHPMLLLAKYRGQRLPVVAVEKNQPVVLINGHRKTLPDTTPLTTQLAEDFHAAVVEFSGQIGIGKRTWETPPQRGAYIPDSTELREYTGTITLTSATEVPDAYVMLTYYDSGAMDDPAGGEFCKSALFEVGTLHPQESRTVPLSMKVHMPLRYSNGDPSRKTGGDMNLALVYWQAFSQGVELKTNNLSELEIRNTHTVYGKNSQRSSLEVTGVGMFIYLRERAEHTDAVEAWQKQNRKTNRGALPYAQTPLLSGMSDELPKGASAVLAVDEDGKVTKVAFEPGLPEATAKYLTRCLKLWLYLPALKKGSPTATSIKVPLVP